MDGSYLVVGTVAGEGSTGGGGGTGVEDLAEVGRFVEVDGGGYLQDSHLLVVNNLIKGEIGKLS